MPPPPPPSTIFDHLPLFFLFFVIINVCSERQQASIILCPPPPPPPFENPGSTTELSFIMWRYKKMYIHMCCMRWLWKGELASTITSAPHFKWSNVLNPSQMNSIERLDIYFLMRKVYTLIFVQHFSGKEGNKSTMPV